MDSLPPLQVTVDSRGWSCILDVRLTLARHGPALAMRLAEEMRVFLVPTLWQVLDNTTYYERDPAYLSRDPLLPGGVSPRIEVDMTLPQWETARLELGLSALRIYWAGDALHESSLPKEMDAGVVGRFQQLAEGLSRRLKAAQPDEEDYPLLDGGCDAAALAVAMAGYRPVILTLAPPQGEGEPALCSMLRLCGVPCNEVEPARNQAARAYLATLFARSGALELTWDRLDLAVIHLLAPWAFMMPPRSGEFTGPDATGLDWWQDAAAYWYRLP